MSSLERAGGARDFLLQRLSPVLFLDFVVSLTFCVPEDAASLRVPASVSSSELTAHQTAPSGLALDARGNFFNLEGVDFCANNWPPILRDSLPRFLPQPVARECLHGLGKSTTCFNAAETAPESTITIP